MSWKLWAGIGCMAGGIFVIIAMQGGFLLRMWV